MAVDTILLSDFTDPRFCAAFRAYFAELDIPVRDWDGLFREMNGEGTNRAFLLLEGEQAAGFLQFQMTAFSNWFFEEALGFIREFWIAPAYRRRGRGRALLGLAENYFMEHGASRAILTADPNAVDFYLAGGYEKAPGIQAKTKWRSWSKRWTERRRRKSTRRTNMVTIDPARCTGCGLCAENCAVHAIVRNEDGTYRCNKTWCFACGQCVALCPVGAPAMPGLEEPVPYDPARFDLDPEVLLNAMRFRRSIRRFTGEKASRRELETLLEAGRCAPTSTNSQTVAFTVLDEEFEAMRPKIWKAFARHAKEKGRKLLYRRYENYLAHPDQPDTLFYGGNQMIVVTSERAVDGGLALANMELMAHALGLGALYCGFAARAIDTDPALREYFAITETRHIESCLIIGHTDLRFRRTAPRNPARVQWR